MSSHREAIDDFLSQRRLAFIGLSHDAADFSRIVSRDLKTRGYDVVGVNPKLPASDDFEVAANLAHLAKPVDAAYVMVPASEAMRVVQECNEHGIRRVWLHRGVGEGAVSPDAVAYCQEHEMSCVPGECIEMYLENPSLIHRLHRGFRKLTGRFPR